MERIEEIKARLEKGYLSTSDTAYLLEQVQALVSRLRMVQALFEQVCAQRDAAEAEVKALQARIESEGA